MGIDKLCVAWRQMINALVIFVPTDSPQLGDADRVSGDVDGGDGDVALVVDIVIHKCFISNLQSRGEANDSSAEAKARTEKSTKDNKNCAAVHLGKLLESPCASV